MNIRPVVSQDKEKILELLQQRGTFNQEEVKIAMEVLIEALAHPEKGDYYVFCTQNPVDGLTGYICFGPVPLTDCCYDLYWIAVDQKYARKGVGSRLVEFMEEFLTRKHARCIYIDTSSTPAYQPARSFYRKHGFERACVLRDFYCRGDDKVIFSKTVRDAQFQGLTIEHAAAM